jgi:hypothetical protein
MGDDLLGMVMKGSVMILDLGMIGEGMIDLEMV